MTAWSARTSDGIFSVVIQADAIEEVDRQCLASGNVETGGVLVGRYTEDQSTAIVLEATPPPSDSRQGRSWFYRGVSGLKAFLAQRWHSKERSYYLGEWHYHPATLVIPSQDDFDQMVQIAQAKEYKCREPLLLIFGASHGDSGQRALRAFVCPIESRPTELHPEISQCDPRARK